MSLIQMTTDFKYLSWLKDQVEWGKHSPPVGSFVAEAMMRFPFTWFVPNDDNRLIDGNALRSQYHSECGGVYTGPDDECSVLEMMVALAKRLDADILYDWSLGDRSADWFWLMMDNCGLSQYGPDDDNVFNLRAINETLDSIVRRDYGEDGTGGLWPLEDPNTDQREVEIWYQMHEFLYQHPEIG